MVVINGSTSVFFLSTLANSKNIRLDIISKDDSVTAPKKKKKSDRDSLCYTVGCGVNLVHRIGYIIMDIKHMC